MFFEVMMILFLVNNLVSELRALRVNLGDFELKSVIGRGHFGDVRVVQEKATGDIYALKIINKTKTLKNASVSFFKIIVCFLSFCVF